MLAHFGLIAMSDLSPLCAAKRTSPTYLNLWVHALRDQVRFTSGTELMLIPERASLGFSFARFARRANQ